ncbi:hypothetical protein [Nocardia xishanensis]
MPNEIRSAGPPFPACRDEAIGPDASGRAADQHVLTHPDARDVAKKVARQGIRASISAR